MGPQFGKSEVKKGKTVIVEHTSANPNGPLHIGNLRNVIIGGVLSQILKAVGYNVRQHFFVNDLGAQIGLTALGFIKIYDKLQPTKKIDQWIGLIYAMMNTLAELQEFYPLDQFRKLAEICEKQALQQLQSETFPNDETRRDKIIDIYIELIKKEGKRDEKVFILLISILFSNSFQNSISFLSLLKFI